MINKFCLSPLLVILFATNGIAGPILTLYKDEVQLSSNVQIPLVGGGVYQQSASYRGPLNARDPSAETVAFVSEDVVGGEIVAVWGKSTAEFFGSSGYVAELFAISELNYGSYPMVPNAPIWDSTIDPVAASTGTLNWTFSLDQSLEIDMDIILKGTDGVIGARLYDKTDKRTLFSFHGSDFNDFESFPGGDVQWPGFGNFATELQAGHKYTLSGYASESSFQDDDESNFGFYFPGNPVSEIHTVPEPSALGLLALGLAVITLIRRKRATIGAKYSPF